MFRLKVLFVLGFALFLQADKNVYATQIIPPAFTQSYRDTTGAEKREIKQKKTNSFAIVGITASSLGFLSLFLFPPAAFLLMAGGVVFSTIALKQIRKRKEKGFALATTGIVIGGAGIVLTILAVALLFTIISAWN